MLGHVAEGPGVLAAGPAPPRRHQATSREGTVSAQGEGKHLPGPRGLVGSGHGLWGTWSTSILSLFWPVPWGRWWAGVGTPLRPRLWEIADGHNHVLNPGSFL